MWDLFVDYVRACLVVGDLLGLPGTLAFGMSIFVPFIGFWLIVMGAVSVFEDMWNQ
jgi:hypothetical protein